MNAVTWIPRYLQPFDANIFSMVIIWYVAVSFALHRLTRYWIQSKRLVRFQRGVENLKSRILFGSSTARRSSDDPAVSNFSSLVLTDTSPQGLDRFARKWLLPDQRVDSWNDRFTDLMKVLAPMLGLAGTVAGVMEAFKVLGAGTSFTPQAIGDPVALALRSTWLGILCACFCYAVRASAPLHDLHRREIEELETAWEMLVPIVKQMAGQIAAVPAVPKATDNRESNSQPNCQNKAPKCPN